MDKSKARYRIQWNSDDAYEDIVSAILWIWKLWDQAIHVNYNKPEKFQMYFS